MNTFKKLYLIFFLVLTSLIAGCWNRTASPVLGYAGGNPSPPVVQITQASWFVDPTNGSDANNCTTNVTACKTHAEIYRRWQCGVLAQATNVFILGSLPATDPINVCVTITSSLGYFAGPTTTFASGATAFRTGTLSGVTAAVVASNTPWSVVDTAIANWTSSLGMRGRVTSGPRAGTLFWVAKDLGGGLGAAAARISFPSAANGTLGTVANTDPYQIDTLISAAIGTIQPTPTINNSGFTSPVITFQDFQFLQTNNTLSAFPTDTALQFTACQFLPSQIDFATRGDPFASAIFLRTSEFDQSIINFGSNFQISISNGLVRSGEVRQVGGFTSAGRQFMIQGGNGLVITGGAFQVNNTDMQIFDVVSGNDNINGSAIQVGSTSGAASGSFSATTAGTVWGSGNAGWGLEVEGGNTAVTPQQVVTGTSGDIKCGGEAGDQNNMRGFNDGTGVYTGVITGTWSHYSTNIAGGGFNFGAHNVQRDAHIVTN